MRFFTCGFVDHSPCMIEIDIKITRTASDKDTVNFKAENMQEGSQISLVRATNLFATFHKEWFQGHVVEMYVKSSHPYGSPFLTSLVFAAYACRYYGVDGLSSIIVGDLTQQGLSTMYQFDIVKKITSENLFSDHPRWFNLSTSEIERHVAAIAIQRAWKRSERRAQENRKAGLVETNGDLVFYI